MNHSPSISVIVPVFNCEPFLEQSLASLHAQSFTDFEVIICDDASTDDSVEIAKRWQQKDARFHLFEHQSNVKMTANWNRALQYATGKYVMKLDADDAYTPTALMDLYQAVKQTGVDIAFCRTSECDENLSVKTNYRGEQALSNAGLDPSESILKKAEDWYQLAFDDLQIWHSNAFILPTQMLKDMGGWDSQFGCASDTDLIFRLLERDTLIQHVNSIGVLYRLREGSVSHDFRANDALVDEGYIASLNSLNRHHAKGKSLSYRATLNWYRIYQNATLRLAQREEKAASATQAVLTSGHCKISARAKLIGHTQRLLHRLKSLFTA